MGALTMVLYLPVLQLELLGDDYLMVQLAHSAAHCPRLMLASIDAFFRPTATWTLMLDRALWGSWAAGFHLTNVILHVLNACLLAAVARRVGLSAPLSFAVACLWAASPFAAEPAYTVGARIDELLALGFLALVLVWPGEGQEWSVRRTAAVGAITVWLALSKETWVVATGLVAVLELAVHKVRSWRILLPVGATGIAAAVYTALHLTLLPSGGDYFELSLRPLSKLPHQLAAFLYLEPLTPIGFSLSWRGVLASAATLALAVAVARRKPAAAWVGLGLLLLPQVPTALVPFLPTRYTAIPYQGFLLLLACGVALLLDKGTRGWHGAILGAAAVLVAGMLAAGVVTVRSDIEDIGRASAAHGRLLEEVRAVVSGFPEGKPVLVVRDEREYPLREVAREFKGTPKLYYPRGQDAYALADTAAVLEWVADRERVFFARLDLPSDRPGSAPGGVLVHRAGGFTWLSREVVDLRALLPRLGSRELPFQLVVARSSPC